MINEREDNHRTCWRDNNCDASLLANPSDERKTSGDNG